MLYLEQLFLVLTISLKKTILGAFVSWVTLNHFPECDWLFLVVISVGFVQQEILLFCYSGQLCAFVFALLLPLFGQRLGKKEEGDTWQQAHCAAQDESQPPGSHPARVLVGNADAVWEKGNDDKCTLDGFMNSLTLRKDV